LPTRAIFKGVLRCESSRETGRNLVRITVVSIDVPDELQGDVPEAGTEGSGLLETDEIEPKLGEDRGERELPVEQNGVAATTVVRGEGRSGDPAQW
jgi:hypothetical protein